MAVIDGGIVSGIHSFIQEKKICISIFEVCLRGLQEEMCLIRLCRGPRVHIKPAKIPFLVLWVGWVGLDFELMVEDLAHLFIMFPIQRNYRKCCVTHIRHGRV